MGKTRELFKKIRDTRGTFHAKTGTVKDRNSMDLIDAGPTRATASTRPRADERTENTEPLGGSPPVP